MPREERHQRVYFEDMTGGVQMPAEIVTQWFNDGDIEMVSVPWPSKRQPERVRYIYRFSVRQHKVRDDGAKMGAKVIQQVAFGSKHHIGLMNEWRPCLSM